MRESGLGSGGSGYGLFLTEASGFVKRVEFTTSQLAISYTRSVLSQGDNIV
jgi:hypothetical protein